MIAPMTRYDFILLDGEQDRLLESLQTLGLVDITRGDKPVDATSARLFAEVERLDGLLKGLRGAKLPEGTAPRPLPEDKPLAESADDILMEYAQTGEALATARRTLEELRPWGVYSRERIARLEEAGLGLHFHRLPLKQFRPEWEEDHVLCRIYEDKEILCFVVAGTDEGIPGEIPAPQQGLDEARSAVAELERRGDALAGQIAALRGREDDLEKLRAEALSRLDLHLAGVTASSAAEDRIRVLTGYAPSEREAQLQQALDGMDVLYLAQAATVSENPPIALKNNRFVGMFEALTDMYGRPPYDGFDPTPFIAVFFLLFFAFCMGDCGYGLVLILIGLLLRRSAGMKKLAPLVITLGAGTTVIGFLFHTFFSMDISGWSLFAPIRGIFLPDKILGYDGTMVLALLAGVLHICLAMVVKTVHSTRVKGFLGSLGTWGWTLLVVGGVIVGGVYLAGVLSAAVTKWVVIVLGVLSALGIFLLNDLHRNPLLNIGSGLWETYNTVTGLLGDVLSYLRLYALGLAGAMLGKAFNDIGMMILGDGSQLALWIPFILVVLVGHTLNVAMAALGAFVHPLRLNFLEFFKNSGYDGSGRAYKPLKK